MDTLCVRCGYNLRGLDGGGRCPECGLNIQRSLVLGQQLRDSRPGWIRSLQWAAILLFTAQSLPAAVALAALLCLYLSAFARVGANLPEQFFLGACVLAVLLHAIGAWLLGRPENRHARQQPFRFSVIMLRLCSLVALLSLAGFLAALVLRKSDFAGVGIGVFLLLPCPCLEFYLLRELAKRVLDVGLVEHSAIVAVGFSASALLLLVGAPIVAGHGIESDLWLILAMGLLVGFLLFWVWSMALLLIFAFYFRTAARRARAAWKQADDAIAS